MLTSQPILQLRRGLVRRVVVEAPSFSIWVWRDSRSPEPERVSTSIGSPRTVQMVSIEPPIFDSQFLVVRTSGPNWTQKLGLEHPLARRTSLLCQQSSERPQRRIPVSRQHPKRALSELVREVRKCQFRRGQFQCRRSAGSEGFGVLWLPRHRKTVSLTILD